MAESPWEWSEAARRYRHKESGKFLSPSRMTTLRNRFTDAQAVKAKAHSEALTTGKRTVAQWVGDMRQTIKATFIDQYVMARGGRGAMTHSDWGSVGAQLRTQYTYLNSFAAEVGDGSLTADQIAARAALYVNSGTQAFERGKASSAGLSLPAYPGDGSTACLSNCRCAWTIENTDTGWDCFWNLGAAESCADCESRAETWNPYQVNN